MLSSLKDFVILWLHAEFVTAVQSILSMSTTAAPWINSLSHTEVLSNHLSHDTESAKVVTWERKPVNTMSIVHVTRSEVKAVHINPFCIYWFHHCWDRLLHHTSCAETLMCQADRCTELKLSRVWQAIYAADWVLNCMKADFVCEYLLDSLQSDSSLINFWSPLSHISSLWSVLIFCSVVSALSSNDRLCQPFYS
jgi:hypothetical protein